LEIGIYAGRGGGGGEEDRDGHGDLQPTMQSLKVAAITRDFPMDYVNSMASVLNQT
jgi:hypothetical protein